MSNFSPPFSLQGQVALITGGGTGLGLATARCMVQAGASVVITGRRADVLEQAAASIGTGVSAIPFDITRLEALPELVKQVTERAGSPTLLVNNAGTHLRKPALQVSDQDFANVMQTHLFASFALAREVARGMIEHKLGSIIFVGSMASFLGIPDITAYTAAKAAVLGLTRALAAEWSPQGVRVNAIVPGWIDSGMAQATLNKDPQRKAKVMSRIMLQHMGSEDDVGWAAVYLASSAAKYVTGSALVMDGGASIGF